ncbi:MAG TPA: methyltransferase domain-containing protein, partial [Holophagaceae bacterium]
MNPTKPKGLFINTRQAACSIHESGRMMYEALRRSDRYTLDYVEIDAGDDQISPTYDFYAFNYHHVGMAWFDLRKVEQLPGLKMTFILEVAPGDPFILCPSRHFDAFLPLDPTLRLPDPRVFPFPRPLDSPIALPPYQEPAIPVIGSFGFATPGKGFELVVDAVNREFDRAVVRLNIPGGTFADRGTAVLHRRPYVDVLEERCRKVAKPGVEVRISRDFLDKEGLIRWCAENTLNCFLYNRDQPGLSATTDQAITSGRPLAVSANPTFRHIHAYLEPYPRRSLRESLARSVPEVQAMQRDWAPEHFARRMEEVLAAHGLLAAPPEPVSLKALPPLPPDRPVVLLVNHPQQQCGIHQYGRNLAGALARSSRYEVRYRECSSEADLRLALADERPAAVVFNYYILTMPWLTPGIIRSLGLPTFGVFHEVTQAEADQLDGSFFDFHLAPDPTLEARNPRVFPIPRLIPTYVNLFPEPDIPTIGSFGFAFSDKGLGAIVDAVQREFDEAIIKLHLPSNDLVASDIAHLLRDCAARVHKPGIQLMVNRKFLDRTRLLDFLAQNSLNLFLYDTHKDRGISSVIEHALAVQRPLAVNRCGMFRHIHSARPSLCIEDRSLREILADGIAPQVPFLQMWNESAFILALEQTFDRALGHASATVPSRPEPRSAPSLPAEPRSESGMATLKQRTEVDQAREILRARGLSFTEPGEAVPGLGIIGDPLTSWDVLRTIEAIEARVPRTGAVLDLGAFSCEILPILHRLGYRQLTGIDLNPDLVRMPHASDIRYVTGDFHSTGLPDASFDAITALSVIEHGFDGPRLLHEVGRLLKPGGMFIASVDYWPEKIPTEGKEIFGLTWRIFSEAELRQFFREGGRYGLEARGTLDFHGGERVVHYEDRDYTFGWFCLTKTGEASRRPVLWLAPEDAASAVASLPALARAVQGLADRRVTVVCPEATRDLHAACPGLDRVLAYDLGQAHRNPGYLKALAEHVAAFQADRLLSPGGPGQVVVETLAAHSNAPERIGFGAAPAFTRLLPLESPLVPEGERMVRLLQALGLPAADLTPTCFLTPEDEGRVRQWVTLQGLDPQRTVFLLAGPAEDPRTPFHLGAALREPLADLGLQAVVLGPPEASEVATHWMEDLGSAHLNACGQFPPRELAALLAHGRVAVGGEGP